MESLDLCHYCITDQTWSEGMCNGATAELSLLLSLQIKQVRRATREEKKRRAMAMREKELGALGLQVSFGLAFTHALIHIRLYMHLDNVV